MYYNTSPSIKCNLPNKYFTVENWQFTTVNHVQNTKKKKKKLKKKGVTSSVSSQVMRRPLVNLKLNTLQV